MDTAGLGERVYVLGREHKAYIVIRVDDESRTVDLVPVSGFARVLNSVSFAELMKPGDMQHGCVPGSERV
jgi:hypothetical protein